MVRDTNVTDWFTAANVTESNTDFTNLVITKKNLTRIEVTFKSGTKVSFIS